MQHLREERLILTVALWTFRSWTHLERRILYTFRGTGFNRCICILLYFIRKVNMRNHPNRYELVSGLQDSRCMFLRIRDEYIFTISVSNLLRSSAGSTLFVVWAGGTLHGRRLTRFLGCLSPPKGRRDKICTRRLARVRVKNVRFYRDGPWENSTAMTRPSGQVQGRSVYLSLSLSFSLSLSLYLSLVRAYTVL